MSEMDKKRIADWKHDFQESDMLTFEDVLKGVWREAIKSTKIKNQGGFDRLIELIKESVDFETLHERQDEILDLSSKLVNEQFAEMLNDILNMEVDEEGIMHEMGKLRRTLEE